MLSQICEHDLSSHLPSLISYAFNLRSSVSKQDTRAPLGRTERPRHDLRVRLFFLYVLPSRRLFDMYLVYLVLGSLWL